MVRYFLALFAMISLAGCQTGGGTFCDLASPIRMTDEQIASLTDAQVAEYLGHNRRGAKFCGWQP